MSPRKSNSEMIAALEAKLAEARAKEIEKSRARAAYLIEAIKSVDEKIAKVEQRYTETVATAQTFRDERITKLEQKRADLDAELAEMAEETAAQNEDELVASETEAELTFSESEAEEV
jgi:uncharacterized coiled-coil protein SlyX